MKKIDDEKKFFDLKKKAEARLSDAEETVRELSQEETAKLIHDLRVHQVELELQNEELRKVQGELEESRDRYSELFDYAPVGYIIVNDSWMIIQANVTFSRMIGKDRDETVSKPFSGFIEPRRRKAFFGLCKAFFNNPVGKKWELRLLKNDRPGPWVELQGKTVHGALPYRPSTEKVKLCRIAVSDVSLRKKALEEKAEAEARLRRREKMESLGAMAGGVAHDFNNVLMAIMGSADLASVKLPPGSPVIKDLECIQEAAEKAAEIAGRMLTYSGKEPSLFEKTALNDFLKKTAPDLESVVSGAAEFRLALSDDRPFIKADPEKLRQALVNLAENAAEAMNDKRGQVRLRSGLRECDRDFFKDAYPGDDMEPGTYAFIEISDDGCGMDEKTLCNSFDPFFTTKFTGRGLGLASALGVVRAHKGAVKAFSTPGEGSRFQLYIPLLDD